MSTWCERAASSASRPRWYGKAEASVVSGAELVQQLLRFVLPIAHLTGRKWLEGLPCFGVPTEPEQADGAVVARFGRQAAARRRAQVGVPARKRARVVMAREMRFVRQAIQVAVGVLKRRAR